MPFELKDVVPWGRTFAEYAAMFALGPDDKSLKILGCGDGPASFNAEGTRNGYQVVSTDPIYKFSDLQLRSRIAETAQVIAQQLKENAVEFVWRDFADPDALIEARLAAMGRFLEDFPRGLREGRYVEAGLPRLPFADGRFDLALCSHFLFLYSQQQDLEFHVASLLELCRVAKEVRVFPLMELGSVPSRHLEAVEATLSGAGHSLERVKVPYEFQKGANEMLKIVPHRFPI